MVFAGPNSFRCRSQTFPSSHGSRPPQIHSKTKQKTPRHSAGAADGGQGPSWGHVCLVPTALQSNTQPAQPSVYNAPHPHIQDPLNPLPSDLRRQPYLVPPRARLNGSNSVDGRFFRNIRRGFLINRFSFFFVHPPPSLARALSLTLASSGPRRRVSSCLRGHTPRTDRLFVNLKSQMLAQIGPPPPHPRLTHIGSPHPARLAPSPPRRHAMTQRPL
jgi:hypothetical protein